MGVLTVGRVGLDVSMNDPSEMSESRSVDSREFVLRGFLRSDTLANTKYIRTALLEQQGQVIALTYDLDDHWDAFYLLSDSRVDTMETSYLRRGLFLFEISLFRIGGSSRVEFQSNLTGTVLENAMGLSEGETQPFVCPPADTDIFDWNVTSGLYQIIRSSDAGPIDIYTADGTGAFEVDATWGSKPVDFYKGACVLRTTDNVQMGLDIPQSPDDWEINNGIIKIVPDGTLSKFIISTWDGISAYESAKTWEFRLGGGAIPNPFKFISAIRNDPEAVTLRVITYGTLARHTIDVTLRRGSVQAFVNWYWSGTADTMKLVGLSTEAATAVTPTGATSTVGCRATANDAGGNRFTIFSANVITNDLTNGGLSVSSANRLNSAIGFERAGSSAVTGDTAEDVALQYFGMMGERVRAVWR